MHNFLYYLYFSTKKLSERFKRVRLFWNLKLSSWFVKSWHFELTFCFLVSISRYKMHCKSLLDSEHFCNWNELLEKKCFQSEIVIILKSRFFKNHEYNWANLPQNSNHGPELVQKSGIQIPVREGQIFLSRFLFVFIFSILTHKIFFYIFFH